MIRLAIVDDHSIVRAGFREMLANELGISVEFEAASGEEALKLLREKPCDVLLLDLSLPGQSGIDVLRTVRQHYEQMKVLVLSGFPEERYALPMMRNGANGYLCKDCEREELLKAIRTVAQGRRYISGKTAELLAGSLVGETEAAPHESLSERELQVFLRLAKGETVSTIADVLNLSVKTVSTYRSRLLEKLEVSSNAELATYAYHNGLVVD
ncbi:MAG: response regulator transcription factor [Candidatus Dechloromonas phosphoritropha]|jgi:DNA-binding NarL/FixJ family response regulator|nr:response regulator transcription factor [Candidatus Dechloromonas phosphoritropha]MBP8788139.1 response regulator transcription factor [Azonexus sp.]MBP9228661.1 response regulator transcription factor [Azonexus sp.]